MFQKLLSKCVVPVVTLAVMALLVFGAIKLSRAIGENLAPVKPRVLIFGATWCPYCPTDAAVEKLKKDFLFADIEHIDVDGPQKALAAKYHVTKLPTIVVCDESGCKVFYSLQAVRAWLTHLREVVDAP